MKLKNTILASTLLSLLAANAFAAKELTPEQAAGLKPFERININGRFNAIGDATSAVSRAADEKGADSFYVQGINDTNGNGGNWRVTADLYKADAAKASTDTQYRVINGVKELPKAEAYRLEPFDTVSVSGFFSSQPAVNDAISRAAQKKAPPHSLSCARLMPITAAISTSPPMSIKLMPKRVSSRIHQTRFLLILKPEKPRWPLAAQRRRAWRCRV